jgi:hypothetical protein
MFQAEYSSGQPLRMLVDLRAAIDDALNHAAGSTAAKNAGKRAGAQAAPGAEAQEAAPAKPGLAARAAAASPSSKFSVPADETPEFEISGGNEWNPNGSGENDGV